jgi:hypothetical protein
MQGNINPFNLIYYSMLNVKPEQKKHLYSTHRDALHRPPFGKSDHNYILLIPTYKQKLKQEAPVTLSIKKWSVEADAKLQDCISTVAQTGICPGILPIALRSKPHQSLASSIIPQPEAMDYRQLN